jgi:RNA polymerase sigma-70 factor (ECF subfamily)
MSQTGNITFDKAAALHTGALMKRALRNTRGNEEEAADLVQDTLLRAFRFWHTFEPGTGLRQWLFTILRNTHITRFNRSKRNREFFADAPAAVDNGADEADVFALVAANEQDERVRAAVDSLPPMYAEAVRAVDLMGMSTSEAAEALGCAPGTVNSRAYRARAKLKEILATG